MLTLSKVKVAPVKRVTLPRLELLGAVMATQLVEFVRVSLKADKDVCRCWTDSMVTLSWIKEDPSRWKPFVANRVTQIQEIISPSQWGHCPGAENPADLPSRGVSAVDLRNSELWLRGPKMLVQETEEAQVEETVPTSVEEEEVRETLISVSPRDPVVFNTERWGKLTKAIRVAAWCLRFFHNVKARAAKSRDDLSFAELEEAKNSLLRAEQRRAFPQEVDDLAKGATVSSKSKIAKLSPYMGEDGLLRVKGRLDEAEMSYDGKHPIIVPRSHLAVLLVRFHHELLKHAGVNAMLTSLRDQYWIVGARRIAKRVKRQCVSCQKQDALHAQAPVAPLHKMRVTEARTFSIVGMDHAGPLYCADVSGKFYILLFTCAVTRAVHLELVQSLNLQDCMSAIRRFIARRGMPTTVWSDNAKTFVAASQTMLQTFGSLAPQWNYIVPRSPWWGGWWERLVKSVKSALKKSVGKRRLTRVELETSLHEVEACINSRPLTFVGDEISDRSPLTPAQFLIGKGNMYQSDRTEDEDVRISGQDLRNRAAARNMVLEQFWSVWSKEYIRTLPQWRGCDAAQSPVVGDLVLIREDGCPRMLWPVGVVKEVFPGKDGVVRACEIRTKKGTIRRALQRLHCLELDAGSDLVEDLVTAEVVGVVEDTPAGAEATFGV
jgi:hypothetical protein